MAPFSFRVAPAAKVVIALVLGAGGCASRGTVADPSVSSTSRRQATPAAPEHPVDWVTDVSSDAIVSIHRSKCGACHTPVEPGSLARGLAEAAMQRHHRRVKLTDRQWGDMVDYLSNDGAHARSTARIP